jgi:hypothetical protein
MKGAVMSSILTPELSHAPDAETQAAIRDFGIVRVPSQTFEYGGYRYSNIKDAVAEAKRCRARGEGAAS